MARYAFLLCLAACDAGGEAALEATLHHEARGQVVARVGAASIGADDVREVMRATGLSSHEALSRLVSEELLAEQAQLRGYGRGADYARAMTQARARALLEAEVEAAITPASIDETAVRARFERDKARLSTPEARHSLRLQVAKEQPPGVDARAVAEAALARLSALPEDAQASELRAIESELGAANMAATLEERDRVRGPTGNSPTFGAIDGMDRPGVVPRVVDEGAFYQVIVVTDVQKAHEAVYEEREELVRRLLVNEARAVRTQQLLESLAQSTPAQYDEQAVERMLADDSLLGIMP